MAQIELNEGFRKALDLMENSDKNVFITGRAGTGKSTLLTYFQQNTNKKAIVLAPTGVAALNVKGRKGPLNSANAVSKSTQRGPLPAKR